MLKLGLATAVVVAILDQLSKALILAHFAGRAFGDRHAHPVLQPGSDFNRGMSFGMFNAAPAAAVGSMLSCSRLPRRLSSPD